MESMVWTFSITIRFVVSFSTTNVSLVVSLHRPVSMSSEDTVLFVTSTTVVVVSVRVFFIICCGRVLFGGFLNWSSFLIRCYRCGRFSRNRSCGFRKVCFFICCGRVLFGDFFNWNICKLVRWKQCCKKTLRSNIYFKLYLSIQTKLS